MDSRTEQLSNESMEGASWSSPFNDIRFNQVYLPSHIENLLLKMGYHCHRSLARINETRLTDIENVARDLFGSAILSEQLSAAEKVELFGPLFSSCPESFQLLPGEKDLILATAEISARIVKHLDSLNPNGFVLSTSKRIMKAEKRRLLDFKGSDEGVVPNAELEGTPRSFQGKSIDSAVKQWLDNCKRNLSFTATDFLVMKLAGKNLVKCLKCKTVMISVTKNANGVWKIANFTRHILLHHQVESNTTETANANSKESLNCTAGIPSGYWSEIFTPPQLAGSSEERETLTVDVDPQPEDNGWENALEKTEIGRKRLNESVSEASKSKEARKGRGYHQQEVNDH